MCAVEREDGRAEENRWCRIAGCRQRGGTRGRGQGSTTSRSGEAIRCNYTKQRSRYAGRCSGCRDRENVANAGVQLRSDQTDRRVVTGLAARLASRIVIGVKWPCSSSLFEPEYRFIQALVTLPLGPDLKLRGGFVAVWGREKADGPGGQGRIWSRKRYREARSDVNNSCRARAPREEQRFRLALRLART